ncbi:YvrJ family protein [Propionispira raffinosivorans]|nr:YvrJ family protein [Propionispira raffinosivorans]
MPSYGFPIVVSAFLLVRIEKKLDILDSSICDLIRVIEEKL